MGESEFDKEANDNDRVTDSYEPSSFALMSRSERKRHRERQRRSDVNKGLDDLLNLLVEVDADVRTLVVEERSRRAKIRNSESDQFRALSASTGIEDNIFSRVDLIERTTTTLRRVHRENELRKQIIEQMIENQSAAASISFNRQNERQNMCQRGSQLPHKNEESMPSLIAAQLQREALLQQIKINKLMSTSRGRRQEMESIVPYSPFPASTSSPSNSTEPYSSLAPFSHGGFLSCAGRGAEDINSIKNCSLNTPYLSGIPVGLGRFSRLGEGLGGSRFPPLPSSAATSTSSLSSSDALVRELLLLQQHRFAEAAVGTPEIEGQSLYSPSSSSSSELLMKHWGSQGPRPFG